MPEVNAQIPRDFAAKIINSVQDATNHLAADPGGRLRDLTFEQAAAVAQIQAINGVAAALLAVADAISNQPTA